MSWLGFESVDEERLTEIERGIKTYSYEATKVRQMNPIEEFYVIMYQVADAIGEEGNWLRYTLDEMVRTEAQEQIHRYRCFMLYGQYEVKLKYKELLKMANDLLIKVRYMDEKESVEKWDIKAVMSKFDYYGKLYKSANSATRQGLHHNKLWGKTDEELEAIYNKYGDLLPELIRKHPNVRL